MLICVVSVICRILFFGRVLSLRSWWMLYGFCCGDLVVLDGILSVL